MSKEHGEAAKEQNKFQETITKIVENYKNLEQSLVNQLRLETPNHQLTTGTYREAVWRSLFEQIIPRKFCIDQGVFIIDSCGKISAEVDLAIFDEQYTPYIFNYGKIKFIPIEAVAVVIQCKGQRLGKENLGAWVQSIEDLKTSLSSVARVMKGLVDNDLENTYKLYSGAEDDQKWNHTKAQTSTRPIRILCSTTTHKVPFKISNLFDISLSILNIKNGTFRKTMSGEGENYDYWYRDLNHYGLNRFANDEEKYKAIVNKGKPLTAKKLTDLKISGKDGEENVIMSLIFQLNQMLMLVNNPMLFPHEAYAKMFNDSISDGLNLKNGGGGIGKSGIHTGDL